MPRDLSQTDPLLRRNNIDKWDLRFMDVARLVSTWSKDPSTQVGAVITDMQGRSNTIRAAGFNGLPRRVNDDRIASLERPEKYFWFEHAERNAIYDAANRGVVLEASQIFVYPMAPCADCARAIIQSGIYRVVYSLQEAPNRWEESTIAALEMLREAHVIVETL